MNQAIVNQYFKALEALLLAGTTYAKAVKALIPEYNKASPEDRDAIRNRVAQVIGKMYGVKPKVMEKGINKGLLGFDAHGSKAESNARDFMRDNFSITKKVVGKSPTKKVSTQKDIVEQALTLVESMTKAQQEKFFKRVSKK